MFHFQHTYLSGWGSAVLLCVNAMSYFSYAIVDNIVAYISAMDFTSVLGSSIVINMFQGCEMAVQ